ncbi:unnamed protein product [Cuscuta europaea]|uniref:Uncharacterized protein n=1 Tax=Cuscuta europaea TaxID=41803 RepID=A0A9P0ZIW3_CUSEU|nr:unnamed protein product [Cuscuta europaea]
MERIVAGYQPSPQPLPRPYMLHVEQTPQVPHMGHMGYHSNSGYGAMPAMGSTFGSLSSDILNQFQSSGGGSRGSNRGSNRGGNRGGSRGSTRPLDTVDAEEDHHRDYDDNDDAYDYDDSNFYHNGVRRAAVRACNIV